MSSRTFAYRSQDPDFLASSTREHFATPVELAQLAQTLECQLLHLHVVRCRSRCICVVLHYIYLLLVSAGLAALFGGSRLVSQTVLCGFA